MGSSVGVCVVGTGVGAVQVGWLHPPQSNPTERKNWHVYSGFSAIQSSQFFPSCTGGHAAVGAVGPGEGLADGADVGGSVHVQPTQLWPPLVRNAHVNLSGLVAYHSSQFLPSCTGGHASVGAAVGLADGAVGHADGAEVGAVVGEADGAIDGDDEGDEEGECDGDEEGTGVDGDALGAGVGDVDGLEDGNAEGEALGVRVDGEVLGLAEGACDGLVDGR